VSEFLVRLRQAEISRLGDKGGPATALIRVHGESVRVAATDRARRSKGGSHGRASGFMAEHIITGEGTDRRGFFVAVITTARTPKGFPYGSMMELLYPYLLPGARRADRVLRKSGTVSRVRLRKARNRPKTLRKRPKRAHI
jgi:hypothetical protein